MKKTGLGRGLDALLPDIGGDEGGVRQIPLSQIDRNPGQPRQAFDDDSLAALSESIKSSGILQPLLVTEEETGRYTWWTFRAGARIRNIGWRIDYFFVSKNLFNKVKSAEIHEQILGSDHCPISIELED